MPTVTSRGRALTSAEVNQYWNTIGTITPTDLENTASLLYGMQHDVFMVWAGWECGEGYANCSLNSDMYYDGYMCSCVATNRYAGYGFTTAQGLCDSLRGTDPSYTVASMTAAAQSIFDNYTGTAQQNEMKALYLSLTNPDQRPYGFSGWNAGVIIFQIINWSYQTIYCSTLSGGTNTYGYDVDGGVLGGGFDVYSDTGVPTKLSEFRAKIFHALACPTGYWSGMGIENFGYWTGSLFYFDCVNLIKAILGGWFDNRSVIGLCSPNLISQIVAQTGDCTEWELITQCSNVSQDFGQLTLTSVLYMPGHIGCFVGDYVRDGVTYNVIECTSGSYGNGVISSYVDRYGRRYANASSNWQIGTWTHHGLLTPWLTYDVGNIDPGGSITPVNPPPGGEVTPPYWENPNLGQINRMPFFMMLRNRNFYNNRNNKII